MIPKVKSVNALPDYRIEVTFNDEASGIVDIAASIGFRGILAKLSDPDFFNCVQVGRSYKTVTWPGQLDLDPVMLYHRATGKSIEWILAQDEPSKPVRKRSSKRVVVKAGKQA